MADVQERGCCGRLIGKVLPGPPTVGNIVMAELCERFVFYSIRAVLALYLTQELHYDNPTTNSITLYVNAASYLTAFLGGIVTDSWLGKYRTIFWGLVLYFLGPVLLMLSSIHPDRFWLFIGLSFVALGTGGIKPCVSPFGAEQFDQEAIARSRQSNHGSREERRQRAHDQVLEAAAAVDETAVTATDGVGGAASAGAAAAAPAVEAAADYDKQLERFFLAFYFAINSGSVLSYLLSPLVREELGFPYVFAMSVVMILVSLIVFSWPQRRYVHNPPSGSVLLRVIDVMVVAGNEQRRRRGWCWCCSRASGAAAATPEEADSFVNPSGGAPSTPGGTGAGVELEAPATLDRSASAVSTTPPANYGAVTQPAPADAAAAAAAAAATPTAVAARVASAGGSEALLAGGGGEAGAEGGAGSSGEGQPAPRRKGPHLLIGDDAELGGGDLAAAEARYHAQMRERAGWLNIVRGRFSDDDIDGATALLAILPIMGLMCIFWTLFDQQASAWTLQAESMKRGWIPPDALGALNPVACLILIPLFGRFVFPAMEKLPCRMLRPRPLNKVGMGMVIAALAFLISAAVQSMIDNQGEGEVSIAWIIPQYVVITTGEILLSVTGLEFSYSQAPPSMKGTIMSIWLLTTAVGDLLGGAVYQALGGMRQRDLFLLFAMLQLLAFFVFVVLAMIYRELPKPPKAGK